MAQAWEGAWRAGQGRARQGRAQHSQGLIAQTLKKLSEEELIAFPHPAFSCSVVFVFLD